MRTLLATVIAGILGMLLGVGATLAVATVQSSLTPKLVQEECDVDPTVSGLQGYCVQRRSRSVLWGENEDDLMVVAVFDGAQSPRATLVRTPWEHDKTPIEVDFEADGIRIRQSDGLEIFLPEKIYVQSS